MVNKKAINIAIIVLLIVSIILSTVAIALGATALNKDYNDRFRLFGIDNVGFSGFLTDKITEIRFQSLTFNPDIQKIPITDDELVENIRNLLKDATFLPYDYTPNEGIPPSVSFKTDKNTYVISYYTGLVLGLSVKSNDEIFDKGYYTSSVSTKVSDLLYAAMYIHFADIGSEPII